MKRATWTAVCLLSAAGAALAQDGPDKRVEELKKEFERSAKALQEKFEQERSRLEKEFKAARERLLEKQGEPGGRKEPRGVEDMLAELQKRVESLERKLEKEVPRLRELPRVIPRDFDFKGPMPGEWKKWVERVPRGEDFQFDFKNFGDKLPEEWRKWLEQMPHFQKGEDFKFEFRKAEKKEKGDGEKDEKKDRKKEKEKKKDKDDDGY